MRRVGDDPDVVAVVLRMRGPLGGWAAHEDLRETVLQLRRSGKHVAAQLRAPGNAAAWVATALHHSPRKAGVSATLSGWGTAPPRKRTAYQR